MSGHGREKARRHEAVSLALLSPGIGISARDPRAVASARLAGIEGARDTRPDAMLPSGFALSGEALTNAPLSALGSEAVARSECDLLVGWVDVEPPTGAYRIAGSPPRRDLLLSPGVAVRRHSPL
jgi:hypothetical protein